MKKTTKPQEGKKKRFSAPLAPTLSPKISNRRKTGLKTLGGLEGAGGGGACCPSPGTAFVLSVQRADRATSGQRLHPEPGLKPSGCSVRIRLWPRLPHGGHRLLSFMPMYGASSECYVHPSNLNLRGGGGGWVWGPADRTDAQ